MGQGEQIAIYIVIGVAVLAIGAGFAGRAEGAISAIAALGCTALGLMVLADLLIIPGLTIQSSGGFTSLAVLQIGLLIGAGTLALLALVLILMSGLMGLAWATRRRRFLDLASLAGALVALLAGVALTAASLQALPIGPKRDVLAFVGFGLGTLAAALIAFRALPTARRIAGSPAAHPSQAG